LTDLSNLKGCQKVAGGRSPRRPPEKSLVMTAPRRGARRQVDGNLQRMCKPDIVYVLDRGHRLHFWASSSMPGFRRGNSFVFSLKHTEQMKAVAHFPLVVSNQFEADRLVGQYMC